MSAWSKALCRSIRRNSSATSAGASWASRSTVMESRCGANSHPATRERSRAVATTRTRASEPNGDLAAATSCRSAAACSARRRLSKSSSERSTSAARVSEPSSSPVSSPPWGQSGAAAMESTSSNTITLGAHRRAEANRAATRFSASPTREASKSAGAAAKTFARSCAASCTATCVLPEPGGPTRSTPSGGLSKRPASPSRGASSATSRAKGSTMQR
mmetsp:Transcript_155193/g.497702  ORF Transcript_155193/g.497702 Transcript_155193/m.497702 type:complete len:217 (-) Transcript_155193:935-1585(-)